MAAESCGCASLVVISTAILGAPPVSEMVELADVAAPPVVSDLVVKVVIMAPPVVGIGVVLLELDSKLLW